MNTAMCLAANVNKSSHIMKELGLRKLASNTATILVRQLLAGLLQLALVAIIARLYGPEGYGVYAVAMLLPSMLTTFLNLGIGPANVFYLGSRQFSPRKVLFSCIGLALILSLLGIAIGAAIILFKAEEFFPGVQHQILWLALLSFPFGLMQSFISSIFQGLQKFGDFNRILLLQPLVMLIVVAILMLTGVDNLYYFMLTNLAVILLILFLSSVLITKYLKDDGENIEGAYFTKAIDYGYKAHLSNILAFVNYKADIFLVNCLINPAATGVYIIAVSLSEKLWILSRAVSATLLPRLSELSNEEHKRLRITPLVFSVTLWATAFISFIVALVVYPLIPIIFGAEYIESYLPFLVLLPGVVVTSASRILANDLAARGKPELNMYTSWFVVVCNIIGNIYMIPLYGLLGAALATTLAYMLDFLMKLAMYHHITRVPVINLLVLRLNDLKLFIFLFIRKDSTTLENRV